MKFTVTGTFKLMPSDMAYNIMIQGTMSNVGKSLLTAALCRVLHQDGYRCAPFKSQNMALNSGVTKDGLEMGRAQILQAFAAGIEPDVRMNPVLLKPCGDTRSQVIVNGEVLGQYIAREYFAMKKKLFPGILSAYESLAGEVDVVVIEGAGSPAEINLKEDDIVNMGLARLVDAPVLLVGDIDPGGVFAQLYGTVKLLEEDEQRRIRGLIINKFRGDLSLLTPGIAMLEEKLGIPVVGTLPYLPLSLEAEDSLAIDTGRRIHGKPVDIAVIRLPRISNFTDLDPLCSHPLFGVRYVRKEEEYGAPDLVILPGTKSTLEDLAWLRESGLAGRIMESAAEGAYVLGICGGFQMLGAELCDPDGTEGRGAVLSQKGLGLLPATTVFRKEKTRLRVRGMIREGYLSGVSVYGYEIHSGVTQYPQDTAPENGEPEADTRSDDGKHGTGGCWQDDRHNEASGPVMVCARGNVCGTYLHGLFDSGEAVDRLAELLARRKGLSMPTFQSPDRQQERERELDALADAFRRNVDMEQIMRILRRSS